MAENCEVCGVKLENTNYKYCLKCINKVKEQNLMQEVLKKLNGVEASLIHLNWNAGSIMKNQRLYYMFKMSESYGDARNIVRRKIYDYFLKELDKDLKQLKQIKDEQEK